MPKGETRVANSDLKYGSLQGLNNSDFDFGSKSWHMFFVAFVRFVLCRLPIYIRERYPILKFKIAYALFGPPSIEGDMDYIEDMIGYTSQQMVKVSPIYERICSYGRFSANGKDIHMSILFVCLVKNASNITISTADNLVTSDIYVSPVFKIRKCINPWSGCVIFLDDVGREYTSWQHYLKDNKQGSGYIVSPHDGCYTRVLKNNRREVSLEISKSPADSASAIARRVCDIAGIAMATGTMGVIGASVFVPITAGVSITMGIGTLFTGVYGIASSSITLADRSKHNQSIGFKDPESRGSWLNIGASVMGVVAGASSQILSKVASNGVIIGNGVKMAHDVAIISAFITGGAGFANSIATSIINYKETGKLPSRLELFQMTASALFFTNSLINNKMATQIITETQSGVIYNIRTMLGDSNARRMFDKVVAETQRISGVSQGNSEIIKGVKHIDDVKLFFDGVIDIANQLTENVGMSLNEHGELVLNGVSDILVAPESSIVKVVTNTVSAMNVITRSSVQTKVINFCVTAAQLFESFPILLSLYRLKDFDAISLLFDCFSEVAFYMFVQIVNYVFESVQVSMLPLTQVVGIHDTQIFRYLLLFIRKALIGYAGHCKVNVEVIVKGYFRDNHVLSEKIENLFYEFMLWFTECDEMCNKNDIQCHCGGIRFSSD